MIWGLVFFALVGVLGVLYFAVTGIAAYNGTSRIWAAGVGMPVQFGKHRLPRFLLPAWHKDWLDRGADRKELVTGEFDSAFSWLRPRRAQRDDQRKQRK